ncbi:MAG: hypothetical protein RBQ81_02595 [Arcobacteraceae bacterium]|jgi:hypothetical protein|nr:hypothetical protein [Arcobacteraceae bacterium]
MATKELCRIGLSGTQKGAIIVANVSEPYGANTDDVVSIGIALNGQDVEWKTHIPYDNIDALIEALKAAKEANK